MTDSDTVGPWTEPQQIGWDKHEIEDLFEKHEPIYGIPENPENHVKIGKNWVYPRTAGEYELLLKMAAGVPVNISRKKYNGSTVTEIEFKDSNIDDKIILDVGCGIGKATITAIKNKLKLKIVGIDTSVEALQRLSKEFGIPIVSYDPKSLYQRIIHRNKYELRIVNANDLSIFPDNYFDGVLARFVLRYIDLKFKTVSEWARVTKPNGHLVIVSRGMPDYSNSYLGKEEIDRSLNVPSLRSTITPLYKSMGKNIELVYSTKLKI